MSGHEFICTSKRSKMSPYFRTTTASRMSILPLIFVTIAGTIRATGLVDKCQLFGPRPPQTQRHLYLPVSIEPAQAQFAVSLLETTLVKTDVVCQGDTGLEQSVQSYH